MSDRPVVHAVVGYITEYGVASQPTVKTLDEAEEFARVGFYVMVDPFDMEDLTRWEQIQRSMKRRWLR